MAPVPSSPNRHFQANSPFTKDQSVWVVQTHGKVTNLTELRRAFRRKFCSDRPRDVPSRNAFRRLVDRFDSTGSTRPVVGTGRGPTPETDIDKVKKFFEENPQAHVREASQRLDMSFGKVWKVLRKNLSWKPYRPHHALCLTPAHKASRLKACEFWLKHGEEWFDKVLWSDEKWFHLVQTPNKKNTVTWAPSNPHDIIPCKVAHGTKVMAWVGILDGRCLPVHWFQDSVNAQSYLEMLQTVVWPVLRRMRNRKDIWFQQDGAPCHVAGDVMEFLESKFGDQLISRGCRHHWPAYSPDLSPLDFSFWPQAVTYLIKEEPSSIEALKRAVENFAASLSRDQLRRMARHTRRRAELCAAAEGGYFEHVL